jgi:hypothetical protein
MSRLRLCSETGGLWRVHDASGSTSIFEEVQRLAMDLESRLHLVGIYGVDIRVLTDARGFLISLTGASEKIAVANRMMRFIPQPEFV